MTRERKIADGIAVPNDTLGSFDEYPAGELVPLLRALLLLWRRTWAPNATTRQVHKSAVPRELLLSLGIDRRDIEYLVRKGYVRDVSPTETEGPESRASHRARFLPTDKGLGVIDCVRNDPAIARRQRREPPDSVPPRPHWDRHRHELKVGPVVVKRFRKSAPNQERVLDAFEELGWPERVDDPLPVQGEVVPATRLHDTIKRLNCTLTGSLLHFVGDGTGRGIEWRIPHHPEQLPGETNRPVVPNRP